MEGWSGGVVEWWSGGVVEWWSGGVVEWWSGGVVDMECSNKVAIAAFTARTRSDRINFSIISVCGGISIAMQPRSK